MRVFLTGATGFVGRALVQALLARGDRVVALSRRAGATPPGVDSVVGDPKHAGEWQARLSGCDAVVHLAGESIDAGRLDEEHRRRVRDSRILGTRHLVAAIGAASDRPRVLVAASGADYYPFDDSERAYDESLPPGETFLARLCRDWEAETAKARDHGARVVSLRTGVVLGPGGGALEKMKKPFLAFVGGPIGSGEQWFSWVSLEDAVGAYLFALTQESLWGPVNLVAPESVRQKQLARALGHELHRPAVVPVPGFALKLGVGGLAEYLLHGRRVVPSALERSGYAFRYGQLAPALAAAL
jgi:uncharacterized protein (TIGR01777 family)